MADIEKCSGAYCPRRDTCFRHVVADGNKKEQKYGIFPLLPTGECKYYWDIAIFRGKKD